MHSSFKLVLLMSDQYEFFYWFVTVNKQCLRNVIDLYPQHRDIIDPAAL